MVMSNQKKQERFRKKEYLKRKAEQIFIDWQFLKGRDVFKNPKAVKDQLDNIVKLPANWTDEDYENAEAALNLFQIEIRSTDNNLLDNDIEAGRDSIESYILSSDPQKWLRECKNAKYQAKSLIEHLKSAFALTGLNASDKSAVGVELVRKIGFNLFQEKKVPCSDATVACLFVANQYHTKPDWFVEKFAELIKKQLNQEQIAELIKKLGE